MSKRIDIKAMDELYQLALDSVEKALFVDAFDKHGWTKEEYYQYFTNEAQSVADYEAFVKPLIQSGHVLLN